MKIIVVSDIHGRGAYLDGVLSRHPDCEGVFFLGDGARDIDTDSITGRGLMFGGVLGNCDPLYVPLGYPFSKELLLSASEYTVMLTHGDIYSVKSGYERAALQAYKRGADILLFGHTHIPVEKYIPSGTLLLDTVTERPLRIMNPGSLREGSYGILQIKNRQILFSHGTVY
jgi:predicted phosphodiesterase